MLHLESHESTTHEFYDGAVTVREFNFKEDSTLNDAEIALSGRYPAEGYAINDISTVMISVEEGSGGLTIRDSPTVSLSIGDRLLIKPGEPYYFSVTERLVIRYIATPAWTPSQARLVD